MGWAPIPPGIELRPGMDFVSLSVGIPGNFWIFVGGSHFLDQDIHPYVLPYERNLTIINYTTIRKALKGSGLISDPLQLQGLRET